MSFQLPSLVEEAINRGLKVNQRTISEKEVRFYCPFCIVTTDRRGRRKKYHLSINQEDNVFKCWYCNESGGALRFIALLDNQSEEEVLQRLREEQGYKTSRRRKRRIHPAETIPAKYLEDHLKRIGQDLDTFRFMSRLPDSEKAKRHYLNHIWSTWQHYLEWKKRWLYIGLLVSIITGKGYDRMVSEVKEASKNYRDESFLKDVLGAYTDPPKWAEGAEKMAEALVGGDGIKKAN